MHHRSSTQISTVISTVQVSKEGWLHHNVEQQLKPQPAACALYLYSWTCSDRYIVPYAGPCTAPLDAATQVGRRRSSSFSSTSEPVTAGSGGPSYGWGDGGSGYTTGAAAAAAASGGRKQLHNRQGGSGYTTGAAAVAAAAGSGRREQLYSKPAPGEAEHRTCSSR